MQDKGGRMGAFLFWVTVPLGSLWGATALWVQFPQARWLVLPAFAALVLLVITLRLTTAWGWPALALAALLLGGWYASLTPKQDGDWAPDVARIVKGRIEGNILTVENIRDFRWQTETQTSQQNWISRQIDLGTLEGADMITSVWGNPLIAHLLVSFRFKDQAPLTFSVEIRREKGEKFSALGGFFRQFEQSLIAATEEDIVAWRAGPRAEEVRLYPLTLQPEQLRPVLEGFIAFGNALNEAPQWYNTVTANCTTVVWSLSKAIGPHLPLDISLLASGKLPEYLDSFDALAGPGDLAAKRARALISLAGAETLSGRDFSAAIRQAKP